MPLRARLMLPHGRLIGFLVTAAVSTLLLVLPVYSDGQTLRDVSGNRVVFSALAIPLVIALTSLAFARLKITAAIAMSAFVVIAGFSIGIFYLPSAVLLIWPERR